jgi:hypothetical protein
MYFSGIFRTFHDKLFSPKKKLFYFFYIRELYANVIQWIEFKFENVKYISIYLKNI